MIDVDDLDMAADDDVQVRGRLYLPEAPRSVVVLAGALAVPQRFYGRYARDLAGRGHAVLTVDYRGIGRSRGDGVRGHPARAMDWLRDLDAALATARERFPDLPLSVVAHSFGGQVLPLSAHADALCHVVTVGTQFALPRYWSGALRLQRSLLFSTVLPGAALVFGYVPGWTGIGEDLPPGVAIDWARWCRTPDYLLPHVPGAYDAYAAFRTPIDAYAIGDDDYAPETGVRAWAGFLQGAQVHRLEPGDIGLDALGHFAPFKPQAIKLWDRIAAHLDEALSAAA